MSRFHSYLNSAVKILSEYDGKTPFSLFIKRFFSKHKKYGSRDRRLISDYCYQYLRTGKAFPDFTMEEKVLVGIFLSSSGSNPMLETHKPEWNELADSSFAVKAEQIGLNAEGLLDTFFPWKNELSIGIEFDGYARSFFIKPSVFFRIRPGKKDSVISKLERHEILFNEISDTTISVEGNSKLDQILNIDSEIVIQDLSSQKVGGFLSEVLLESELKVWDCCAASGGKSLMAFDINSTIKLSVSDIRDSILHNLDTRFKSAGIKKYDRFKVDLTRIQSNISNSPFDVIIADLPCSGSGTWSRTPEQLFNFKEKQISKYSELQRRIVSNAVPHLKKDGFLVYITCSVFKRENEENVDYIVSKYGLEEIKSEVITGYRDKADSMFVSVLRRSQ